MASLAQQESQSLSQNVRPVIQYRYQQGKLQNKLLKKVSQRYDYNAIADEILRLLDQRRQTETDSVIKIDC